MNQIFLIRYSCELVLKGKNRIEFERTLIRNIKAAFPKDSIEINKEHQRVFLLTDLLKEEVIQVLKGFIGISSISPVIQAELTIEDIIEKAAFLLKKKHVKNPNLKILVKTKRANKEFPMKSPDVNGIVGSALLTQYSDMKVDFKNPDVMIGIEIREKATYLFTEKIPGANGLPVGTAPKMVSLLSGGIDSPVASWYMMRRGSPVVFATYHSPPFLEEEAYDKILSLAKKLKHFQSRTRVYQVFFTDVQKAIKLNTHDKYRTILYRRFMHRIASRIAEKENAGALITGESLGQVASQTLENLVCIASATNFPVMRPLVGFGKEEIIQKARDIDTYETSIQPYGDCCTLFAPQNPTTKAKLEDILEAEKALDVEDLVLNALEKTKIIDL